jgi:hypothetical protein
MLLEARVCCMCSFAGQWLEFEWWVQALASCLHFGMVWRGLFWIGLDWFRGLVDG